MRPKKSLGQHFLAAPHIATSMAAQAVTESDASVLEIGPGKGVLTRALLEKGARVTAIEKDHDLIPILKDKFSDAISEGKLKLIEGDVRDLRDRDLPEKYKLVANIPYYITGEIIRTFLTRTRKPSFIALLVQDEVAKRIATKSARGGSAFGGKRKESILSISVKAYGTPRYVRKVPRSVFKPAPSVDSAVLIIEHISNDRFKEVDEEFFFKIVRAGFASKRKMLLGNLSALASREMLQKIFSALSINEKIRAEDIPFEKWFALTKELSSLAR